MIVTITSLLFAGRLLLPSCILQTVTIYVITRVQLAEALRHQCWEQIYLKQSSVLTMCLPANGLIGGRASRPCTSQSIINEPMKIAQEAFNGCKHQARPPWDRVCRFDRTRPTVESTYIDRVVANLTNSCQGLHAPWKTPRGWAGPTGISSSFLSSSIPCSAA